MVGCTRSWGLCPSFMLQTNFPCPGPKFLMFYANQLSCTIRSSKPFYNGLRASGIFDGLDPLLLGQPLVNSPWLLLDLIPAFGLYCVMLMSRSQNKDVCPRKMLSQKSVAPLFSHILFFLTVLSQQQTLAGSMAIHGYWCLRCTHQPPFFWPIPCQFSCPYPSYFNVKYISNTLSYGVKLDVFCCGTLYTAPQHKG